MTVLGECHGNCVKNQLREKSFVLYFLELKKKN